MYYVHFLRKNTYQSSRRHTLPIATTARAEDGSGGQERRAPPFDLSLAAGTLAHFWFGPIFEFGRNHNAARAEDERVGHNLTKYPESPTSAIVYSDRKFIEIPH